MFLENNLKDFGLTEKEAKVYLAALELGSDTVQNIAKKAGLKRPTVYLIIQELMKKSLLSEKPASRGSIFIAESPEKILAISQQRQNALKEAIPFLRSMYNTEKGKPQVRVYEGLDGMRQLYHDEVWKSKTELLFFASTKKIQESLPGLLQFWITNEAGQRKFTQKTRELLNSDPEDIEYGLKSEAGSPNAQVRIIPPDSPFKFIGTDNVIFEDKIMMASFDEKLFTTLIQSEAIAQTMRTLYELAWGQAIPLKEFLKKFPNSSKPAL